MTPDWDRYRGCNHEPVPQSDYHRCGMFSFAKHIGGPLTDELWADLIQCWHIKSLWIISPRDEEWCLGRLMGACTIKMDVAGDITDIQLTPPWNFAGEPINEYKASDSIGRAIMNSAAVARADFR